MRLEIAAEQPGLALACHGVNAVGHELSNAEACNGRVLPWLQDLATAQVWELWAVTYRDCVILDPQGRTFAIYNLSVHDLGNPVNYAELKALLIAAAQP